MLVQAVPIFQDAHILRRSMLEALSDYAFLTNQYLHKGYADGILAGCELTTTKDAVILNEGVLLFEGQLFLVKEPMMVNYHPTNVLNVLRLKFSDVMRDANFIYREVDMLLADSVEMQKSEMELCRFTLQEGAELRYRYRDFEDRNTDYDTLNQVHAPYAAYGGSTLAPEIVRNFAEETLDISGISDYDALFCMQILQQGNRPIPKTALKAYLKRKGRQTEDSNLGIYLTLAEILREQKGMPAEKPEERKKKWRVTVE